MFPFRGIPVITKTEENSDSSVAKGPCRIDKRKETTFCSSKNKSDATFEKAVLEGSNLNPTVKANSSSRVEAVISVISIRFFVLVLVSLKLHFCLFPVRCQEWFALNI